MSELAWDTVGSPVGTLSLGCSPAGLARIRFGQPGQPGPPGQADEVVPVGGGPRAARVHLARTRAQIAEYFGGQRRTFDVPLDWSAASFSQRQVLSALLTSVGFGETVTYGALARRAGLTDGGHVPAARVAGQIMGANPIPVIVPCHRVVASDGLGGYSGGAGVEIKRWLLIFEGAQPPTLDWDPAGPTVGLVRG